MTVQEMREVLIKATEREHELGKISKLQLDYKVKGWQRFGDALITRWYNLFFQTDDQTQPAAASSD